MFTKKDLKNGMMVECTHGARYLIMTGIPSQNDSRQTETVLVSNIKGWNRLEYYDDNLKSKSCASEDIDVVFSPNGGYALWKFFEKYYESFTEVWRRDKVTPNPQMNSDLFVSSITERLGSRSVTICFGDITRLWHVQMVEGNFNKSTTWESRELAIQQGEKFLHRLINPF